MNSQSKLEILPYERLDSEIHDSELSIETVVELYTSYADFFTLPMLHNDRFKKEVLRTNYTMYELSSAFDDISQKSAKFFVHLKTGALPSNDYREDNAADQINIAYINSLLGSYLDTSELGGIAIGETDDLIEFFDSHPVHWKFIICYEEQLAAAAKAWYEKFAKDILDKNSNHADKALKEKKLLKKAAKLEIIFESLEEKDRLTTYIREKVAEIDTAQAYLTFRRQVKDKINNAFKMFKWGKEIKQLKFPTQTPNADELPSIKDEDPDSSNCSENSSEKTTNALNSALFSHPQNTHKRKAEDELGENKTKQRLTQKAP